MRVVKEGTKSDSSTDIGLKRYILGELTEQEEDEFSRKVMAGSSEFVQELDVMAEVVQDELIEDYAAGRVAGSQKTSIESRFLSCDRMREKLLVETALRAATGRRKPLLERLRGWLPTVLSPAPALALCATLVLVAGGVWSILRIGTLEAELAALRNRPVVATPAPAPATPRVPDSQRSVIADTLRSVVPASILLKPGLVRSGGTLAQIRVGSGQNLVELRLDIGIDEYPHYRVVIRESRDIEILMMNNLRAVKAGNSVEVKLPVPVQILPPDDYQVRLSGLPPSGEPVFIDSYPFRVLR